MQSQLADSKEITEHKNGKAHEQNHKTSRWSLHTTQLWYTGLKFGASITTIHMPLVVQQKLPNFDLLTAESSGRQGEATKK